MNLRRNPRADSLIMAGLILCALCLAGLADGRFNDRSETQSKLTSASGVLTNLPLRCNDWRGSPMDLNPEELKIAEAAGAILRRYTHQKTGEVFTVLALCGSPGPISVHPPTACYTARGYRIEDSPIQVTLSGDSYDHTVKAAEFANPAGFANDRVGILWTWSADGTWSVPSNPRFQFADQPALFKLYVTWDRRTDSREFQDSIPESFFRELTEQFRNHLTRQMFQTR